MNMKKKLIWILLALFLIGSGGMAEAQVVKKSVKETPVVIEEEDEEDEEDYDDEEDDGDLDEEDDDDVVVPTEDEITVTDKEGNEELIEFPEAMTYDLDSLLNLYMSKTYLTGTNDCEMKDVNPTYSREIYIERLSRIPSVMELSYNDVVQKFIDGSSALFCQLHVGRHELLYASIRRSLRGLSTTSRAEILAYYRIGTEPESCIKSRSSWFVAIYARNRKAIWFGTELPCRRTSRPREVILCCSAVFEGPI